MDLDVGFPAYVDTMHKTKHESDTRTYNRNREFDGPAWERVWNFDKYSLCCCALLYLVLLRSILMAN
jgi:hypothetical protein